MLEGYVCSEVFYGLFSYCVKTIDKSAGLVIDLEEHTLTFPSIKFLIILVFFILFVAGVFWLYRFSVKKSRRKR